MLYLNPEHDVIYVRPTFRDTRPRDNSPIPRPRLVTVLVDFLHDIKAYDPKDQGLAHLALHSRFFQLFWNPSSPLSPAILHHIAAASFADILRGRLRSVLCIVSFRSSMRSMGQSLSTTRYHFAQTFPFGIRGVPTSTFSWLETDPRPSVEVGLHQLSLSVEPGAISRSWTALEDAFGISSQPAESPFRLHICPSVWCPGARRRHDLAVGSREELAHHLAGEAESWLWDRQHFSRLLPLPDGDWLVPRHGTMVDAKTFEMMERVPCTAIGMWLFPAEAFKHPYEPYTYDVSSVSPSLFLFESASN